MERINKEAVTPVKLKDFSTLVGESLGRASMAWSETPKGIFNSDTCSVLHIDILNAHAAIVNEQKEKLRIATEALEKICSVFTACPHTDIADETLTKLTASTTGAE